MADEILRVSVIRPCKKCLNPFFGKHCKPCATARKKAWKLANPELEKLKRAAEYAANREVLKAKGAVWRATNPDKVKSISAAYRKNHAEKAKESQRKYFEKSSEKIKKRSAIRSATKYAIDPGMSKARRLAWNAANPGALTVQSQNRRARVLAADGSLSLGIAAKLFILQKGRCICCNRPLGDEYDLDHIVSLARGGSNTDVNVQLLRRRCNQQKSTKHPVDFMQSRGFLI